MRILLRYLKAYRGLLVMALVLAAINQVFSMLDPYIFRLIIDHHLSHIADKTTTDFIRGVGGLLLLAMGVALVSRVAKNFQDYFLNVIVQRLGARIYADGLRHSLELPYPVFEDQRSGETLGKLQKARADSERLIQASINIVFTTLVGVIFVMVYAVNVHWAIAPAFFAAVPILFWLSSALGKRIKRMQKAIVAQTTALAGATTESLRNVELVKSLGLAAQEISRLNTVNDHILGLELKKVRYMRGLSFIQGTSVNFLRTCILFLMMWLIFSNKITVGQFFSLWIYSFFIFGPLQEMGNVINIWREAQVSLKNFADILAMEKEKSPLHPAPIPHLNSLSFSQVGFRHPTATRDALQDISFDLAAGGTMAFVGPSGAGKTTLVKLLVGLYLAQRGTIRFNGHAAHEVDLEALRSRIGFVTQDTQLFSGTIRENLLFASPHASDTDCLEALEKAACQTLMERADKGLGTVIGEGGVKVSGGEKQRLSIARALLRKPDLLVFDEATSSLDSLTEEEITTTIRAISKERSLMTLMIAHRLSTIMHADTIFVLERGRIVEQGGHEALVRRRGLYYALWRQQVGEKAETTEWA